VITDAAIKDDEKRAKAQLRMSGIMAIATGALEVVRAAASFASFNFVQGALHTAAATLAFAQGTIMLAGNIPGRGSASVGGGAPAAPAQNRATGEAARIVESVPAADGEPTQRPTGQQAGGNVVNINIENVAGGFDDSSVEDMSIKLKNAGFALEGA
jgi:hypothetical protein